MREPRGTDTDDDRDNERPTKSKRGGNGQLKTENGKVQDEIPNSVNLEQESASRHDNLKCSVFSCQFALPKDRLGDRDAMLPLALDTLRGTLS